MGLALAGMIGVCFATWWFWNFHIYTVEMKMEQTLRAPARGLMFQSFGPGADSAASRAARMIHSSDTQRVVQWLESKLGMQLRLTVMVGRCAFDRQDTNLREDVQALKWCTNVPSLSMRGRSDESVADDASLFMLMHEFGHIVVADERLNAVGNEESIADEFATLLAAQLGMERVAVAGAAYFASTGGEAADVHEGGLSRAASIRCLLYGMKPTQYEQFVRDGARDDTWRMQCRNLYDTHKRRWNRLMQAAKQKMQWQKAENFKLFP